MEQESPRKPQRASRFQGGCRFFFRIVLAFELALILQLLASAGCVTTVIPPSAPLHPTTVVITDYGRHSSILLPDPHGGLVEYAFGDWAFFALGHKGVFDGLHALFHSPQSTLGRRRVLLAADAPNLAQDIGADKTESIIVDGDRVAALEAELDREYARHIDRIIFNSQEQMYFVPCDEPYNVIQNCNRDTAKWLEKLGAQTQGLALLSHFRVAKS